MSDMKTLREVCAALDITRRVVQGYEEMGLVTATDRNKYGYLLYDENAQKRIAQIMWYRELGFSKKEIKEIIDAPAEMRKKALILRLKQLKEDRKYQETIIHKAQEMIDGL